MHCINTAWGLWLNEAQGKLQAALQSLLFSLIVVLMGNKTTKKGRGRNVSKYVA
jgi:hypothetical protein